MPRNLTGLESSDFGFVSSPGGSTLVTSLDGRHWDQLPADRSVASVTATGFAASARSVILTTGRLIPDAGQGREMTIPLFWRYTDGLGWSTVNRGDSGAAYIRTLFGDRAGFGAGGATYTSPGDFHSFRPTVWDSTDGTRWQTHQLSKTPGREVDAIARSGLGLLAVGGEPGIVPRVAWLVPTDSAGTVQEYEVKWDLRTVVGLADRFVGWAASGVETSNPDQPAILIVESSDAPYDPVAAGAR